MNRLKDVRDVKAASQTILLKGKSLESRRGLVLLRGKLLDLQHLQLCLVLKKS